LRVIVIVPPRDSRRILGRAINIRSWVLLKSFRVR
jgi:hypothetical protein